MRNGLARAGGPSASTFLNVDSKDVSSVTATSSATCNTTASSSTAHHADYVYSDPSAQICDPASCQMRSLASFYSRYSHVLELLDPETGGFGELTVKIPLEFRQALFRGSSHNQHHRRQQHHLDKKGGWRDPLLQLTIHYSVQQPRAGLFFSAACRVSSTPSLKLSNANNNSSSKKRSTHLKLEQVGDGKKLEHTEHQQEAETNTKAAATSGLEEGGGEEVPVGAHLYTHTNAPDGCARLWLPCVDSPRAICTWTIRIAVPHERVTAVAPGQLHDCVHTADLRGKLYVYHVTQPISAQNLAIAVGDFDTLVDPLDARITHFCPRISSESSPSSLLRPLLENSVRPVAGIINFYENAMNCAMPCSLYKLVFVEDSRGALSTAGSAAAFGVGGGGVLGGGGGGGDGEPAFSCSSWLEGAVLEPGENAFASGASITLFSMQLLHHAGAIDQEFVTRRALCAAAAEQFFGHYVMPRNWSNEWLCCGLAGYLAELYARQAFGRNESRFRQQRMMQRVTAFEQRHSPVLLDPSSGSGSTGSDQYVRHLRNGVSAAYLEAYRSKALLVFLIIECRLRPSQLRYAMETVLFRANSMTARLAHRLTSRRRRRSDNNKYENNDGNEKSGSKKEEDKHNMKDEDEEEKEEEEVEEEMQVDSDSEEDEENGDYDEGDDEENEEFERRGALLSSSEKEAFSVSTSSLQQLILECTGLSVASIIRQWVMRAGHVRFALHFVFNRKKNTLDLKVAQSIHQQQQQQQQQQDSLATVGGVGGGCVTPPIEYLAGIPVVLQELDGAFSHRLRINQQPNSLQQQQQQTDHAPPLRSGSGGGGGGGAIITCSHELPMHSKMRKNRRKKVPLASGIEVEIYLPASGNFHEDPLLWMQLDPDMTLLRVVRVEQPDYMHCLRLRYCRDVCAQIDSAQRLGSVKGGGAEVLQVLIEAVRDGRNFHRVRSEAALALARLCSGANTVNQGVLRDLLDNLNSTIQNDPVNFLANQFVQRSLVRALSTLRNIQDICPVDILPLLENIYLLRDNSTGGDDAATSHTNTAVHAINNSMQSSAAMPSVTTRSSSSNRNAAAAAQAAAAAAAAINSSSSTSSSSSNNSAFQLRHNRLSDTFLRCDLLLAMTDSVDSARVFSLCPQETLPPEAHRLLQLLVRAFNMDRVRLRPSYALLISQTCLRCLRRFQQFGYLSAASTNQIFADIALSNHVAVPLRQVALDCLLESCVVSAVNTAAALPPISAATTASLHDDQSASSTTTSGGGGNAVALPFDWSLGSHLWCWIVDHVICDTTTSKLQHTSLSSSSSSSSSSSPQSATLATPSTSASNSESERLPRKLKLRALEMMSQPGWLPPFFFKLSECAQTSFVELVWRLINCGGPAIHNDARMRAALIDVYAALFGMARPACLEKPSPASLNSLRERLISAALTSRGAGSASGGNSIKQDHFDEDKLLWIEFSAIGLVDETAISVDNDIIAVAAAATEGGGTAAFGKDGSNDANLNFSSLQQQQQHHNASSSNNSSMFDSFN